MMRLELMEDSHVHTFTFTGFDDSTEEVTE